MDGEQPRYAAYLLRLWQVTGDRRLIWRASLEDVCTGERHGFADLEQLIAFLERQLGETAQPQRHAEPATT